ncbi:phage head-tail connector protein [Bradyrhizobium sp. 174]|uniref:phage head-tail connector protein n=1 Tax=Bradyrhizobium sp. 174 TaxID=2782645 RepID=UPI001FF8AE88|nr:phage head-tail connector protein [Bradyrhizobium sp. 174]MCK1577805.1 phage head-tail connector protein [Bradyrhizobium sp. 174]
MFTVITPATSKGITTLENLKADLNITGNAEDPYLTRAIKQLTSRICSYMNVPYAQDGTRTIGFETLEEKFGRSPWMRSQGCETILARKPVSEIVSVMVGSTAIPDTSYELDGPAGMLRRVWDGTVTSLSFLPTDRTVIRFKAGWSLPGDDPVVGPPLPEDIEACAISLIKATRAARTRDPLVKAQWVTDIERLDFWVGAVSGSSSDTSGLPPELTGLLDPYCYESI